MVHVADLLKQRRLHRDLHSPEGLSVDEQLAAIKPIVVELAEEQHRCWTQEIQPRAAEAGIVVVDYDGLTAAQRTAAEKHFNQEIFPVLTPLAFDPGHP